MSRPRICVPAAGPVTQGFGIRDPLYTNAWGMHLGIDIATSVGDPVVAIRTGRVLWAGDAGTLGLCVVLGHADASRTVYAHLSHIYAVTGQRVRAGRRIGLAGNTGLSTGPHTHVEVWLDGTLETGDPYALTRDDPTALPADPAPIWRGRWPCEGVHTPGWEG